MGSLNKQILTISFLTLFSVLFAGKRMDSLKNSWHNSNINLIKLEAGLEIAQLELRKGHIDSIIYYHSFLKDSFSSLLNWKDSASLFLIGAGILLKQDSFIKALELTSISKQLTLKHNDINILKKTYRSMFTIKYALGLYDSCSDIYIKILRLVEDSDNNRELGDVFNMLGFIQQIRGNYDQAIQFHQKAIVVRKKINFAPGLGASHHNIADCHINTGNLDSALFHAKKALKFRKIENSKKSIAEPYQSLGIIYCQINNEDSAHYYLDKAINIWAKHKDQKDNYRECLFYKAELISSEIKNKSFLKDFEKKLFLKRAIFYCNKIISLGNNTMPDKFLLNALKLKSECYYNIGLYKKALISLEKYHDNFKIKIEQENKTKLRSNVVIDEYFKTENEKNIAEQIRLNKVEIQNKHKNKKNIQFFLWFGGISLLIISCVFLLSFRAFRYRNKMNAVLNEKNILINNQNIHITDSINYAKRIQNVLFDTFNEINNSFKEYFVFYEAKQVVSGDYYGYYKTEKGHLVFCVDCSGTGVFGAFLSIVCNSIIEKTINHSGTSLTPSLILKETQRFLLDMLNSDAGESLYKERINLSICLIDQIENEITFCGTYNDLILANGAKISPLKANNKSIELHDNGFNDEIEEVTSKYNKGDMLYIMTNGYADQYGGGLKAKFTLDRLIGLISQSNFLGIQDQKELFSENFHKWRGEENQTDDVLLIGIRL